MPRKNSGNRRDRERDKAAKKKSRAVPVTQQVREISR